MGERILKAFECWVQWPGRSEGGDIIHAKTAAKARYSFLLAVQDCRPDVTFKDVCVRREPTRDMQFPELPPIAVSLDEQSRDIILHMFGGGSHVKSSNWGYRDHYCGSPKDERLLRLVELGLLSGPFGTDKKGDTPGWINAFYYLTDHGKTAALALIGERECAS